MRYRGKGPYLEQLGVNLDSVAACPFCKKKELSREFMSIHCNSCGADGPECDRRAELSDMIAAWNRIWTMECREQKIIRLEHITDYEACEAAYRAFHSVRDHTCIPVVDMRRSK